jgi:hypothetical protein
MQYISTSPSCKRERERERTAEFGVFQNVSYAFYLESALFTSGLSRKVPS